eukprot:CCRYP_014309-RF/>CCRYP_014309-RF protein AED:0.49 eAED:1.00 QI:0/-1/0/1/-1/0/1/0/79
MIFKLWPEHTESDRHDQFVCIDCSLRKLTKCICFIVQVSSWVWIEQCWPISDRMLKKHHHLRGSQKLNARSKQKKLTSC